MEEAAREGNAAEFASYFLKDSRPFAEALIALYATEGPAEGPAPTSLALLSRGTVESEVIEGDVAYLSVRAATEEGAQAYTLVFKKEEGDWRLDLKATEAKNRAGMD